MRSRRKGTSGIALAVAAVATMLAAAPVAAQDPLATQDSASKQPTIPTQIPDLTVPGSDATKARPQRATRRVARLRPHGRRREGPYNEIERPALANVELPAPLAYPPQPPHVTVPTPAYPPETFVTRFTTPPPPVVCRPAPYDPDLPNPHLVDERPVVCTADNP